MPTFDVYVYPIFRTTVRGIEADSPRHAALAAETAVIEALAYSGRTFRDGRNELDFADGLDTTLVRAYGAGGEAEWFSIGPMRDEAAKIAGALQDAIRQGGGIPAKLLSRLHRMLRIVAR